MTERNHYPSHVRLTLIVGAGLVIALGVVACSIWQRSAPTTRPPSTSREPVRRDLRENDASSSVKTQLAARNDTPDDPVRLRALITQTKDYPARLELRRHLFHRLRNSGRLDQAMPELTALLEDVEREEGSQMAQRVALAEAGTLEIQKDYRLAANAYELILNRFGEEGRFATESRYHLGTCQLDMGDYAAAADTWQRLIQEHDESPEAPWAWRKTALAQTLQGQFGLALSTLSTMKEKYANTEFGEYAAMRVGYVQMVAGKPAEARKAYSEFLSLCPGSKYCHLVQMQMEQIEKAALVRADSKVSR